MMQKLPRLSDGVGHFFADETGATAIEYALIASMISIAILGAVMSVGTTIRENFYDSIAGALQEANSGSN